MVSMGIGRKIDRNYENTKITDLMNVGAMLA